MKVYHGTSGLRFKKIRKQGITPRKLQKGSGNWSHSIESNPDTVYLTDAYAGYFGIMAMLNDPDPSPSVIIEIDTDALDPKKLVADEDVLEQVSREGDDGLPPEWGMVERTRYYRGMTRTYAKAGLGFDWSMRAMGTGGHIGAIPAAHFTRVATLSPDTHRRLLAAMSEPTITVMNYQIMAEHYRRLIAQAFGDPIAPTEMDEIESRAINCIYPQGVPT